MIRAGRVVALALWAALWAVRAVAVEGPSDPVIVTLETTVGEIDVAVFVDRAPLSAADFLRYVDQQLLTVDIRLKCHAAERKPQF